MPRPTSPCPPPSPYPVIGWVLRHERYSHWPIAVIVVCGYDRLSCTMRDAWDSSVVRASDSWSKGHGYKSWQDFFFFFFFLGQLSVLTLISLFDLRSIHVLLQQHVKDPGQSAKSAGGRLQLNTHTPTLPMWLWMKWHCKLMHSWTVYTERAPRRATFYVAPAMQQPKNAVSTPLPWILIMRVIKGYSHSFRITCQCVHWACSRAESSAI